MTLLKVFTPVARALLTLAVPVVLLFSPLYPLVTPAFVHWQYTLPNVPPADIYTPTERIRLSDPNLLFLRGRVSRDDLAALRTDGGAIAMRSEEVQHMADVRAVMSSMYLAHGIALALALLCGGALWLAGRKDLLRRGLRQGVAIVGALIGLILLSSVVDFDVFFTAFHGLFFEAGTWTFYATDTLIQLYPLPFWMNAVIVYGALVLLGVALVWGLSYCVRERRATPVAA